MENDPIRGSLESAVKLPADILSLPFAAVNDALTAGDGQPSKVEQKAEDVVDDIFGIFGL